MILQYYGGYMRLDEIGELFHMGKNGTNAYDMVEGIKSIGFFANGFRCSLEQLIQSRPVLPCIAHVTLNQSYSHFVVIYEIHPGKKELLIADPANKILKVSYDIFKSIYSENLIILYPLQPVLPMETDNITWKSFVQLLRPNRKMLWHISFVSIFVLLYSILTSFYGEMMFHSLNDKQETTFFLFLFLLFGTMTLLKLTGDLLRNKILLWIEKKIDVSLYQDIYQKVLSLSYHYYHNHTTGDILSRLESLEDVKKAICKLLIICIIDIPLMVISFLFLYLLSAKMAVFICIFLFMQLFMLKLFQKPLEEQIQECHKDHASLATLEVEGLRSFETVKGISISSYFEKRWITHRVQLLNHLHALQNLILLEDFGKQICEEFSSLVLLLLGCLLVQKGEFTYGTLITIQSLSVYFYTPVRELMSLDKDLKQAKQALERASVFTKKVQCLGYLKTVPKGTVRFQKVSFSYRPNQEILHQINLSIKEGEKVLILGESGSGKSTLFKLLKKYYEIPRGMIQIGENDLNDYENSDEICYINQTENLFTGSLLENITLSRKINEQSLKKVMDICEVDEIAEKDMLGYLRLIEENGMNLSGGEKQRVVLARTILQPFQILIIDEGLNQLDVNLERRILKKLFQRFQREILIIISHREENLDLFDRKVRLVDGKIVEDVVRI